MIKHVLIKTNLSNRLDRYYNITFSSVGTNMRSTELDLNMKSNTVLRTTPSVQKDVLTFF
jgi:hypothetical protein